MCSVKRTQSKADFDNKECSDNLKTRQDLASLGSCHGRMFSRYSGLSAWIFTKQKILYSLVWLIMSWPLLQRPPGTSCWIMSVPHNLKHSAPQLLISCNNQSPLRHQCLFKYSSFPLYRTEHTPSFWGFSYLTKQIWYERSHTLTHHISEMIKQNQRTSQRSRPHNTSGSHWYQLRAPSRVWTNWLRPGRLCDAAQPAQATRCFHFLMLHPGEKYPHQTPFCELFLNIHI